MRGALSLTWFCLSAVAVGQTVPVFNPSFEQPVVPPSHGVLLAPTPAEQGAGPADSPWVFTGPSSGLVATGTAVNIIQTVPSAPDGNQWAYLPVLNSSISQVLTFPAAGEYTVTLKESGDDPLFFSMLLDDSRVTSQSDPPSSPIRQVWATFATSAGPHTLTLRNVDSRLVIATPPILLDSVAVIPEPLVAWAACFCALALYRSKGA